MRRAASSAGLVVLLCAPTAHAGDPWADAVRDFEPGLSAGFGADALPGIVLGAPEGAGDQSGGVDVVSLGHGGTITVVFRDNAVADGPGDDLVVFENAFFAGGDGGALFDELAFVDVSADGKRWVPVAHDPVTHDGLAGRAPVYGGSESGIDPLSPQGGGDRFDLADVGLPFVRFVRLQDAGDVIDDLGNRLRPWANKAGFDLDAAAALHSVPLSRLRGVVHRDGAPVADVRLKLVPPDGGKRRWRTSRNDGGYRFARLLPLGLYRLRVREPGGVRTTFDVRIDGDAARVRRDLPLD